MKINDVIKELVNEDLEAVHQAAQDIRNYVAADADMPTLFVTMAYIIDVSGEEMKVRGMT